MRAAVDAELREVGLTWSEFKALAVIGALEGASQEAIHDRAAVDRGSLSRLVDDLEYEGLIHRYRGTDARKVHCSATAAGIAAAAAAASAVDDGARKALRFLHAKERSRLHVLMGRALDRRDRVVLRRPCAGA